MIGGADALIRSAAFSWLTEQREDLGDVLPWRLLVDFHVGETRVPLIGQTGIWKPAACELPISIATTMRGQYPDSFDERTGTLRYSYRGTDPNHRDNAGLRRAMRDRVPLVYFHAIEKGQYLAAYPVFVVEDHPDSLAFTMQVDDVGEAFAGAEYDSPRVEARRAYLTRTVRQRMHQAAFRQRVVSAYQQRCALCLLRHQELLDAAHIIPDRDIAGDPIVSNGIALCKLHHAAFDRLFFAIRPDFVIEVRPSILTEVDGPMLVVGLQQIHDRQIYLPRRSADRPDPVRLQRRYEEFLRAG